MRVILDTSVLIASERHGIQCSVLLEHLQRTLDIQQAAISVISIMELTHGVYRARTEEQRLKRRIFVGDVAEGLDVYPITTEIAQRAGRIEGEQASLGIVIDTTDLLIGTTALVRGFSLLTSNVRHFERLPELNVIPFKL